MHCQSFFERMLSSRAFEVSTSIVDREHRSVPIQKVTSTHYMGTLARKDKHSNHTLLEDVNGFVSKFFLWFSKLHFRLASLLLGRSLFFLQRTPSLYWSSLDNGHFLERGQAKTQHRPRSIAWIGQMTNLVSPHFFVHWTDLCFAICRFHLQRFIASNSFKENFLPR